MARRRAKVLVVDGDRERAFALFRALYDGNQTFDVLVAGSADIARELMREVAVEVVVIDIDLPGGSGVELVCWAAIEFPETVYVGQTRDDVEPLQEKMAGLGCLRLVRKPCPPADILRLVHDALDCIHRLSGCFSALSAADLIQMLCLAQRTAALRISAGGETGTVMVKKGVLLHASWGTLTGQDALCEILDAQDGVFRTTPLPADVPHTIDGNWQHALMEAVRVLDERSSSSRRSTGSLPAIRADDSLLDKIAAEAEPARRAGGYLLAGLDARQSPRGGGAASSLVDKGFAALRAGDVEEARKCWLAAKELDPENRSLDLNLKKLESRATR